MTGGCKTLLLAAGFRLWRIGCVVDQKRLNVQKLVIRHDFIQGLGSVGVDPFFEIHPPLSLRFGVGIEFSSLGALGMAFSAGAAEEFTAFDLAPFADGPKGCAEHHGHGQNDKNTDDESKSVNDSLHDNLHFREFD
jgi:hypothetical protein